MKITLFDIETERSVLKMLFQHKDFCKGCLMYQSVIEEHFTDLFHMDAFRTLKAFFNKFGNPPGIKLFRSYLIKYITYSNKYKTKELQRQIWLKAAERMFQPIGEEEAASTEANLMNLEDMRKARLVQNLIVEGTALFEDGKLVEVFDLMSQSINASKTVDNVIMEGNIVEDFKQHINIIRQQRLGEIVPIQTGITCAIEEEGSGDFKIVMLDDYIGGGLFPGEMTIGVGENNVGKSFLLMEVPVNAARVQKKHCLFFTIEMNKIKQERRIYSRITGIPYKKFKDGTLTKSEINFWKEYLDWWNENCGLIHIVAFDKGATVPDIQNKVKDAENRYGHSFDLISIDYLNDMKPVGRYKSAKDWDAQGEISWDLTQFSKSYNNHKGIPIITASQKKTARAGSASTDWSDAAFSPLPTQHATVGIGIGQDKDDRQIGRVRFDVFKNRDGEKSFRLFTFPNFSVSKISSVKRLNEYYSIKQEEFEEE
jgi:replicative DNA helicase